MKKVILSLVLTCISVLSYGQQKGTNDLTLSVGFVTNNDIINIVGDIFTAGFTGVEYRNYSVTPSIAINYKKAVENNWFVYADGVFQSFGKDMWSNNNNVGKINDIYATVGLGTEYHYVNKSAFQMYSGLSLAYTQRLSSFDDGNDITHDNAGFLNFQVNALGFRVGNKLAAFTELGFGYKGIASLGLSYQF